MQLFAGRGLSRNRDKNQRIKTKELLDINTVQTISRLNREMKEKDSMISGLTQAMAQLNIEIQRLKEGGE